MACGVDLVYLGAPRSSSLTSISVFFGAASRRALGARGARARANDSALAAVLVYASASGPSSSTVQGLRALQASNDGELVPQITTTRSLSACSFPRSIALQQLIQPEEKFARTSLRAASVCVAYISDFVLATTDREENAWCVLIHTARAGVKRTSSTQPPGELKARACRPWAARCRCVWRKSWRVTCAIPLCVGAHRSGCEGECDVFCAHLGPASLCCTTLLPSLSPKQASMERASRRASAGMTTGERRSSQWA